MAGIDKTYCSTWKEYCELREWVDSLDNDSLNIKGYLWEYEESDFGSIYGVPIWNTPERIDKFLAEHCPVKFVRDRLIEVYPKSWVSRYKNLSRSINHKTRTVKRGKRR